MQIEELSLNLSDEQINTMLNNEKFLKLFVQEVVETFSGTFRSFKNGFWKNEVLDKITTGIATKLIENKIDEISKTIEKRVNVLIANKLSKTIEQAIIKSVQEDSEV